MQQENLKSAEGEVRLNGLLIYNGLRPRYGHAGLRVDRCIEDGPHFGFCVITEFLTQSLSVEELLQGCNYTFSGPRLGEVMMRRHTHGGIGPHVRNIVKLDFRIIAQENYYLYELNGETGDLLPWSYNNPSHNYPREPFSFKLWFKITDELIQELCSSAGIAEHMTKKFKSCMA